MNDNVSNAKNIIPHRRVLMSGINVYVARSIEGFLAGMTTPFHILPGGPPPPPLSVDAEYREGVLWVKWLDPTFSDRPHKAFVRVWARLANRHSKLLAHIAVPSSGSAEWTQIRPGLPLLLASDDVLVRFQLDTIIQSGEGVAPVISSGSNVAEAVIINK
ncbi:hypothetical protein HY605_04030 [Candidatus Peregrinibacteria bacterium]|nr:hypothetical protein [Candidatus Peregrinibacteria bacterium]